MLTSPPLTTMSGSTTFPSDFDIFRPSSSTTNPCTTNDLQRVSSFTSAHYRQAFCALTLLVGWQEGATGLLKKLSGEVLAWLSVWSDGADVHMAQLMPLPLTVSCFSKIQIRFTFLVPAYPGSPGKRAVKRVGVCFCATVYTQTVETMQSSRKQLTILSLHYYCTRLMASFPGQPR